MSNPLILYSAPATRSIRIAWLLEELEVPYELQQRTFEQTKSTFFIQDTPTGKFPTIDDNGFVMFESGAITEYLLEKYPENNLAPTPGDSRRGEFLQWLHFADATAFAPMGIYIWLNNYRDDAAKHPQLIEDARSRAATGFGLLETHLQQRDYLLGEQFTAADIMMGFTMLAGKFLGVLDPASELNTYIARITQRPAFELAAEKTGNQMFL